MGTTPAENEHIAISTDTHWIKYVWPTVAYCVILSTSGILFFLAGYTAHHSELLMYAAFFTASILLTLSHHWFFQRLLSETLVDLIITNKRVIYLKSSILFHDDMQEIVMERLRSVEARKKGLLQNILRYGTLIFDKGASTGSPSTEIPLIPHPHRIAHEITQLLKMQ